jgi:hypothetical protein
MLNALDRGDPSLERGTELGETVVLGHGILDDGILDYRATGCDRDREGVAGPARLRFLAALGCRGLRKEQPGGLEVTLDVALQKAGEYLTMAPGAGPRPSFEKTGWVAANADQTGHHGPRNG